MIYVEIWGRDPNTADAVSKGTIGWDGRQYLLDPPQSLLLQNLMGESYQLPGNPSPVTSAEPEDWLEELHLHLKGSRLWASEIKTTGSR